MITGDYDQLKEMAGTHVCAEDNGHLVVAWHKDKSQYYLKCGICGETKDITRVMSLTEQLKTGEELPEPVKSNVEKSIRRRAEKLPQAPQAETFTGIPATDLGTGELLSMQQFQMIVVYARKYDLDPLRSHVVLMYGKPYVTLDGYLFHAHQVNIPYQLRSRPLDEDERITYQIPGGAHAWVCEIIKGAGDRSFIGLGIVTQEEMTETSKRDKTKLASPVVARHPWQLAQKRAEWQALRRAFPIGEGIPGEEGRDNVPTDT
ncbi:MAG: hypothetical protein KJ556_21905 [Gammaproteobacteria bacterium]|nr:hypothetical protein [Gammaproteobacteria bacterium]